MTEDYLSALKEYEDNPELTADEAAHRYTANVKWNDQLRNKLKQRVRPKFKEDYIRKVVYRPFIPTNCYTDYTFLQMKFLMDQIFHTVLVKTASSVYPVSEAKNHFPH